MQDARYLRAQARLCLDIASQLSDARAAEKLRADAADYHARAGEIEQPAQSNSAEPRKP
jgi:hypothetical protein